MSEMVFPFQQDALGAFSRADHAAMREWIDAVRETEVFAGSEPNDGIATDTLVNLDEMV